MKIISKKTKNSVVKNKAGGAAFSFKNPAEYLLATIGSSMFVEPKYYNDVEDLDKIKKGDFSGEGLDEQAINIINACIEVCLGDNPRDILALAHWARTELRMRTTPQVMVAVAAHYEKSKPFVREYVSKVALRADDVKQIVASYERLFGWKGFPACLKKGVSDKLSTLSEYEVLKYNTKKHPTFADLLKFCDRKKDFPFSQPMRNYILTGEVTDEDSIPMVAARKELTSRTEWSEDIPELARLAGATWEVLISQFGNKAEVWETAIPLMGYMALLRNLGNFLSADISDEMVKRVVDKLSSKEEVLRSKQLPFRFLAAHRVLDPNTNFNWLYGGSRNTRNRDEWKHEKLQALSGAVELALEHSLENVIELPGITCVAADNSASMTKEISKNSVITAMDIANVLGAIVHKKSEQSVISSFGSEAIWPTLIKQNSILTNMNIIANFESSRRGHATHAHKVIDYLIKNNIFVDRVVVLSDMQCYDEGRQFNSSSSLSFVLKKYRENVNKNCYLHSFDLMGYGTRQTPSKDPLSNVIGGFSEKIFDNILIHEGAEDNSVMPSLEWIREHY